MEKISPGTYALEPGVIGWGDYWRSHESSMLLSPEYMAFAYVVLSDFSVDEPELKICRSGGVCLAHLTVPGISEGEVWGYLPPSFEFRVGGDLYVCPEWARGEEPGVAYAPGGAS